MMSQMPSVCLALYEVYSLVETGLWEDGIASGFICLVVSSRFQMQVSSVHHFPSFLCMMCSCFFTNSLLENLDNFALKTDFVDFVRRQGQYYIHMF